MGQDQDDIIMMPHGHVAQPHLGRCGHRQAHRLDLGQGAGRSDMKAVEESMRELLRQRFKVPPGARIRSL
jgi:hypothetical protein